MFGMGNKEPADDPLSDAALLKAVRRRLLDEVSARQAASSTINNNVYGGSAHAGGASDVGGLMGALGGGTGGAAGEDPFDYMVDIERRNMPADESGKSPGWTKHVRRHRSPKDDKKKA